MTDEVLEFKVNRAWQKALDQGQKFVFVPEFGVGQDGTKYMRTLGRTIIYRATSDVKKDPKYVCNTCNSEIEAVTIRIPIHDGKYELETIPFCPTCEPNFDKQANRGTL